jgi:hypothetical protein
MRRRNGRKPTPWPNTSRRFAVGPGDQAGEGTAIATLLQSEPVAPRTTIAQEGNRMGRVALNPWDIGGTSNAGHPAGLSNGQD